MKKNVSAAIAATALFVFALTGCSAPPADLELTDGWVRVSEYSDHVDGMTGAFATIKNNTDKDVTLVGGSSEIAGMTEIHEVVMLDGEMKMQPKAGGIVIPAGESVTLEPGGLHVMLMGLKTALLGGEEVTIDLDFEGADDITVTWPAKTSLAGDEEYKPAE
jgi:copper(I)-binding protein